MSDNIEIIEPAREIFVVDDNDEYRDILSMILALEGHHVTGLSGGEALLDETLKRTPICIFLDIVMPGLSGIDVLRKLREGRSPTPIFLMSGRCDLPTMIEATRNGATDFIEKPFDPYMAVLRVRDAVEMWQRRLERKQPSGISTRWLMTRG